MIDEEIGKVLFMLCLISEAASDAGKNEKHPDSDKMWEYLSQDPKGREDLHKVVESTISFIVAHSGHKRVQVSPGPFSR